MPHVENPALDAGLVFLCLRYEGAVIFGIVRIYKFC